METARNVSCKNQHPGYRLFVWPSRCNIDVHHSRRHHLWVPQHNTGREKQGFQHISLASLASAPPSCTPGRCCGRARCQSPADECEHCTHGGNPSVDEHLGTSTLLILSPDPLNKRTNHAQFERGETRNARKTRHTPASAPRGCPLLCDSISPSQRSLCVVAIFLLPMPAVAIFRWHRVPVRT